MEKGSPLVIPFENIAEEQNQEIEDNKPVSKFSDDQSSLRKSVSKPNSFA